MEVAAGECGNSRLFSVPRDRWECKATLQDTLGGGGREEEPTPQIHGPISLGGLLERTPLPSLVPPAGDSLGRKTLHRPLRCVFFMVPGRAAFLAPREGGGWLVGGGEEQSPGRGLPGTPGSAVTRELRGQLSQPGLQPLGWRGRCCSQPQLPLL